MIKQTNQTEAWMAWPWLLIHKLMLDAVDKTLWNECCIIIIRDVNVAVCGIFVVEKYLCISQGKNRRFIWQSEFASEL